MALGRWRYEVHLDRMVQLNAVTKVPSLPPGQHAGPCAVAHVHTAAPNAARPHRRWSAPCASDRRARARLGGSAALGRRLSRLYPPGRPRMRQRRPPPSRSLRRTAPSASRTLAPATWLFCPACTCSTPTARAAGSSEIPFAPCARTRLGATFACRHRQ